jgi:hypothetical protein
LVNEITVRRTVYGNPGVTKHLEGKEVENTGTKNKNGQSDAKSVKSSFSREYFMEDSKGKFFQNKNSTG